ncbi:hypothetical protein CF327_g7488 [Tilletia walkeri]|nr:hypothetical protein CF327_g7488 [Tilletia walkeri]
MTSRKNLRRLTAVNILKPWIPKAKARLVRLRLAQRCLFSNQFVHAEAVEDDSVDESTFEKRQHEDDDEDEHGNLRGFVTSDSFQSINKRSAYMRTLRIPPLASLQLLKTCLNRKNLVREDHHISALQSYAQLVGKSVDTVCQQLSIHPIVRSPAKHFRLTPPSEQ